jgi:CcmD family protein
MTGIYYTLAVTLVVWIGLFLYLLRLDRRISELENKE